LAGSLALIGWACATPIGVNYVDRKVAYPAQYGSSGVMTFVVNHDGVVYEKDIGPKTAQTAASMTKFNPDNPGRTPQGFVEGRPGSVRRQQSFQRRLVRNVGTLLNAVFY